MNHGRPHLNRSIVDQSGTIPANEPVFLIRGRDALALEAIRFYGQLAKDRGAPPQVVIRVLDQADAIEVWQRDHPTRMPD